MHTPQMHLLAAVEAQPFSCLYMLPCSCSQDSVTEGSLSLQSMHEAATHMHDYLYMEQVFVVLQMASFALVMCCTLAVFQVDPFMGVVMKVMTKCASDVFHIFLITIWILGVRFSPV